MSHSSQERARARAHEHRLDGLIKPSHSFSHAHSHSHSPPHSDHEHRHKRHHSHSGTVDKLLFMPRATKSKDAGPGGSRFRKKIGEKIIAFGNMISGVKGARGIEVEGRSLRLIRGSGSVKVKSGDAAATAVSSVERHHRRKRTTHHRHGDAVEVVVESEIVEKGQPVISIKSHRISRTSKDRVVKFDVRPITATSEVGNQRPSLFLSTKYNMEEVRRKDAEDRLRLEKQRQQKEERLAKEKKQEQERLLQAQERAIKLQRQQEEERLAKEKKQEQERLLLAQQRAIKLQRQREEERLAKEKKQEQERLLLAQQRAIKLQRQREEERLAKEKKQEQERLLLAQERAIKLQRQKQVEEQNRMEKSRYKHRGEQRTSRGEAAYIQQEERNKQEVERERHLKAVRFQEEQESQKQKSQSVFPTGLTSFFFRSTEDNKEKEEKDKKGLDNDRCIGDMQRTVLEGMVPRTKDEVRRKSGRESGKLTARNLAKNRAERGDGSEGLDDNRCIGDMQRTYVEGMFVPRR